MAGEGMSSKEIARVLGISPSTVDNHIHTARTKLGAKNRWQAAQLLDEETLHSGENDEAVAHGLPPLGGARNIAPATIRIRQILTIAAIATAISSALIVLVLGVVHVFAPA